MVLHLGVFLHRQCTRLCLGRVTTGNGKHESLVQALSFRVLSRDQQQNWQERPGRDTAPESLSPAPVAAHMSHESFPTSSWPSLRVSDGAVCSG